MQYTDFFFSAVKISKENKNDTRNIFEQNIDCGYTLEPPRYPQSMFWIKKSVYPGIPQFYSIKGGIHCTDMLF